MWVGLAADSDHLEVVVRLLRFLILDVLLPHLVGHVPARGNPVAPGPQMLASAPHIHSAACANSCPSETVPPATPTHSAVSRSANARDPDRSPRRRSSSPDSAR